MRQCHSYCCGIRSYRTVSSLVGFVLLHPSPTCRVGRALLWILLGTIAILRNYVACFSRVPRYSFRNILIGVGVAHRASLLQQPQPQQQRTGANLQSLAARAKFGLFQSSFRRMEGAPARGTVQIRLSENEPARILWYSMYLLNLRKYFTDLKSYYYTVHACTVVQYVMTNDHTYVARSSYTYWM